MAVVSRISTLVMSQALGSRIWTATAAVQDTAAGSSVVITVAESVTGTVFGNNPDALTLDVYIDNGATLVHSFALATAPGSTPHAPQTATLFFTDTGLTGGALRAGTLRMRIHAVNTTGGVGGTYNMDTDLTNNTPETGFTVSQHDQGWVRGTTTAVTTLNAASYAYPDTITATTTLGAAPYKSYTVSTKLGALAAVASAASTTTVFTTAQGVTDNRFPASSNTDATVTTVPNAALVAIPWTVLTMTEASATVDPRLTFTFMHQDNDASFGTPPLSKDVGAQRLTSNLAFLNARVTNAAGTGINGLTWNAVLQDAGALVVANTHTFISATEGGEAGWGSAFFSWSDQLPTGIWNKTDTITAPAGAVGLESGNIFAYVLTASNPNYRMLVGAGPATAATDARHFTPGLPLLVGMVVFDTNSNVTLVLDANPVPSIAIGRFNLTYGRAEYLTADGVTWAAATGATIYYFPLTVSPGDPNAWTAFFASTDTWSVSDLFVVGKCTIGGVPVASFMKEVVVSGVNNHDKYAFDGPGFVGFPSR
jgi:hypothetical protein